MKRIWSHSALAACLLTSGIASAAFVAPGNYVIPNWDPPTAPTLVETSPGSGIFSHSASGLTNGTRYEFKVLEDTDNNPQWGDTEVTPGNNVMLYGDADGVSTISYIAGTGVWVNSDAIPLQVVGDFMDEAGGAGDWNPSDAMFAMTSQGAGLYTYNATISNPGIYEFKATDGTGWNFQAGVNGFGGNQSTFFFSTTTANAPVTFVVDTANGFLNVIPEPASALLVGVALAGFAARRARG